MPIDRDTTLKTAEKLLRQGKLDGAIAEYVRLVEEQPRDWNAVNALGDLYVRAGDAGRAVAQFTRVADHLFTEGFLPRAAALYKKALKVHGDHEPTLLRLFDIAVQQELLADARAYMRQVAQHRRARGDERGAAECLVRLGTLDEADGDARRAAARAARQLGDDARAAVLLAEASEAFAREHRHEEAFDALVEASELTPGDAALRVRVVKEGAAAGRLDRVRALLTIGTAGDDPDLLLALARLELADGNDAQVDSVLGRLVALSPARAPDVVALGEQLADDGRLDAGYRCVDIVVDAALLDGDYVRAVAVLEQFLQHGRPIPALVRLVELCVDAGLDASMRTAQAQLADAYLETGHGAEARVIAEDLLAGDPADETHRTRLRRACDLLGIEDADARLAQYVEATEDIDLLDLNDVLAAPLEPPDARGGEASPESGGRTVDAPPAGVAAEPLPDRAAAPRQSTSAESEPEVRLPDPETPAGDHAVVFDLLEFDLSDALAGLTPAALAVPQPARSPTPPSPPAEDPPESAVDPPVDLERVFDGFRAHAADAEDASTSDAAYARGQALLAGGDVTGAVAQLQVAARSPTLRFVASARLGRVYLSRDDVQAAIEWLERAAEAPAPSIDEGASVLYDLAASLERVGEAARALAILLELQADAPAYRDVAARISHLTRIESGGDPT